MIYFVNHDPFRVTPDEEWACGAALWVETMRHPNYLRIGGRPVINMHGGAQFYRDCGEDEENCPAG